MSNALNGSAPPALRNMKAPAMITLGLLCKLATLVARTEAAYDAMTPDELTQADPDFVAKLHDREVQALLADMRRTGLLPDKGRAIVIAGGG